MVNYTSLCGGKEDVCKECCPDIEKGVKVPGCFEPLIPEKGGNDDEGKQKTAP